MKTTQVMIFLLAIVIGPGLACYLGTAPPHWRIIWIACGATLLLRIIGASWVWSILAGMIVLVIYVAGIAFMQAWIFA